ncbi:MAG: hypothetical protein V1708_01040 [Candidatus Micrarchaeota archaeon]
MVLMEVWTQRQSDVARFIDEEISVMGRRDKYFAGTRARADSRQGQNPGAAVRFPAAGK